MDLKWKYPIPHTDPNTTHNNHHPPKTHKLQTAQIRGTGMPGNNRSHHNQLRSKQEAPPTPPPPSSPPSTATTVPMQPPGLSLSSSYPTPTISSTRRDTNSNSVRSIGQSESTRRYCSSFCSSSPLPYSSSRPSKPAALPMPGAGYSCTATPGSLTTAPSTSACSAKT
jgi:hypothetical protein